jgi:rRNA-processing protein FCF1
MCIVVDANAAHHLHADDPAGALVLAWLLKGKGKLVVSTKLLEEIKSVSFRATLVVLEQARKLCRTDDLQCEQVKADIENVGSLKSNDSHVVALVITEKCELVFSHDQKLHEDLKNKSIVKSGCSIFQTADHAHLLGECKC